MAEAANPYAQFGEGAGGTAIGAVAPPPPSANPYGQFSGSGSAGGPPSTASEPPATLGSVAKQFAYGAGPGLVTGILDTPAWILDMIANPSHLDPALPNTGVEILRKYSVGPLVRGGVEKLGLNPGEPQNATERVAAGVGAGMGAGAGAGAKFGPLGAIVGAIGGGALGGGTSVATEMVPPERANEVAIASGVLGGIGARFAGRRAGDATLAPRAAQERSAATRIAETAVDAEAAQRALAEPPGAGVPPAPTLAQRTGDVGLAAAERALAETDPRFAERAAEQGAARTAALDATTGGSPGALATGLQAERAAREADIARLGEDARRYATEKVGALPGQGTPEELGGGIRAAAGSRLEALRAREDAAWTAARAQPFEASGDAVRAAVDRVYAGLTPEARLAGTDAGMTAVENRIQDMAAGYSGAPLNSQRLIDLTRYVGSARDQAQRTGHNIEAGRLAQVYSGLLNVVDEAAGTPGNEAAVAALRDAKRATQFRIAFEDTGPIAPALERAGPNAGIANATLPGRVWTPGPKGAETARAFVDAVGPEAAYPLLRDAAAMDLRRKAIGPDGTLDPGKFDTWRAQHANALRLVPEMDEAFSSTANASRALEDSAALRRELTESYERGAIGRIVGAQDASTVTNAVADVLKAKNAPEQMRGLADRARAAGPEATEGLRRAVVESLLSKLDEPGGTPRTGAGPSTFLGTLAKPGMDSALRAAGFSPAEIATMRQIGAQLALNRRLSAAPSPTTRNAVANLVSQPPSPLEISGRNLLQSFLTGSIGAATSGAATLLSPMASKATIAAGVGAGAALALRAIRNRGIRSVNDLVADAFLDPTRAKALLAVLRQPDESAWQFLARTYASETPRDLAVTAVSTEQSREREPLRVTITKPRPEASP